MQSPSRSRDAVENRWERLLRVVEAHADILAERGSLVRKQHRQRIFWFLRFFVDENGRRRHRSLYVGGEHDPLVDRVRLRLDSYRQPRRWRQEIEACAAIAAHIRSILTQPG